MITISQHVERWVGQNPFIRHQLSRGLINHSALARYIRPSIQQTFGEPVSLEAITVSLNRLSKRLAGQDTREDLIKYIGDVSVQTGLSIVVVRTEAANFHTLRARQSGDFFVISQGIWHTVIITKTEMLQQLKVKKGDVILRSDNLTGVTTKLEPGNTEIPGVCSLVLQVLANKGINLQEVTSTHNELTVVLAQSQAQQALATILDLKTVGATM